MPLLFEVSPGRRLVFSPEAEAKLRGHAQLDAQTPEAGGILLGRHLLDAPDLVVDDITLPQAQDSRKRFWFFRSKTHSEIALARWRESGRRAAYMGSWHTHPEAIPTPSDVDKKDWLNAVSNDSFEGDSLIFVIVGTAEIRAWSMARDGSLKALRTNS